MFPENRFMEVLIIGALALIVIGPKDLPLLMRRIGQFVGKMRGMANEFRASFDELARQSELDELRREVEALRTSASVTGDAADPHGTGVFSEIKDSLSLSTAPVMTPLPQPELVAAQPEPASAPEVVQVTPKPARKPRAQAVPTKAAAKTVAKSAAAKPATRKSSSRATGPAS
jgi:sec-independent protein translocase protein TatB